MGWERLVGASLENFDLGSLYFFSFSKFYYRSTVFHVFWFTESRIFICSHPYTSTIEANGVAAHSI